MNIRITGSNVNKLFLILLFSLSIPAFADELINYHKGFPAPCSGEIYSQIRVADIDGDGKNEMIFGASDGMIHIYDSEGREIKKHGWPVQTGGPVLAAVNVGDVDGDGEMECVAASFDQKVYCFDKYGKTKWAVNTGGPVTFSSPQLVDMKNDGTLNTIVASTSGIVFELNKDGEPVHRYTASAPVSAPVRVQELDTTGKKHIVVRSNDGKVTVWEGEHEKPGWPVKIGNETGYWPYELQIVDLDGDGKCEIIGGTPYPYSLKILGPDGRIQLEEKLEGEARSAVRPSDIDKNGLKDMVFSYNTSDRGAFIDIKGPDGKSLPGWPRRVADYTNGIPQVADINGDGKMEIIFTGWTDEPGIKAGFVSALDLKGNTLKGFPKYIGKTVAPVTIADLDNDGRLEIIVPGGVGLTGPGLHVFDCPAPLPLKMLVLGTAFENYRVEE